MKVRNYNSAQFYSLPTLPTRSDSATEETIAILVVVSDDREYLSRRALIEANDSIYASRLKKHLSRVCSLSACVHALSSGEYDVVLLDLGLPDAEGFDALSCLRLTYPNTPVVLLSRNVDFALLRNAIALGAADCLSRDELTAEQLQRALLKAAISGRQSRQRLSRRKAPVLKTAATNIASSVDSQSEGRYSFVDVGRSLEAVVRRVRLRAPEDVSIEFEMAPRLPLVTSHVSSLERLIESKLLRVFDKLDGGNTCVGVRTGVMEVGPFYQSGINRFEQLESGFYVYVEISSGTTLQQRSRQRIFEPLMLASRSDSATGVQTLIGWLRSPGGASSALPCQSPAYRLLIRCDTQTPRQLHPQSMN